MLKSKKAQEESGMKSTLVAFIILLIFLAVALVILITFRNAGAESFDSIKFW